MANEGTSGKYLKSPWEIEESDVIIGQFEGISERKMALQDNYRT